MSKEVKRVPKYIINWVDLERRVPIEQKVKYLAFKAKSDGYLRRVQANPAEPPEINWDEYKKIVPIPGLVDNFKSAYAEFKVPYPDDTLSAEVDEQWRSLEPEIKKFCAELQKDIDAVTVVLDKVKALPKFEDMTMEMYYDLYPDDAFDPVKRPTFWPHNPEEQLWYVPPEQKAQKAEKK